jgi:hypothetical protein
LGGQNFQAIIGSAYLSSIVESISRLVPSAEPGIAFKNKQFRIFENRFSVVYFLLIVLLDKAFLKNRK